MDSLQNMEINKNFNQNNTKYLHPKCLTYVPLEKVNKEIEDIKNSESEIINFDTFDSEMFYTDLDKFRSDALKNTLFNNNLI